jgi:hypothetical protein
MLTRARSSFVCVWTALFFLASVCLVAWFLSSLSSTINCLSFAVDENFNTAKRVAYVVSLNSSAPRFLQTDKVLRDFGFDVSLVKPFYVGETRYKQTLSNKFALLTAATLISRGAEPWGYIFEDDIFKHELSHDNLSTVIENEAESAVFQYLGACEFAPSENRPARHMCGRCAHAMGLSKHGATELLRYANLQEPKLARNNVPRDEEYLDVIVQGWCEAQPLGFRVVGPLENSAKGIFGHYGLFLQDRTSFESEIDKAPSTNDL